MKEVDRQRFFSKIIPVTESGCWLWIGYTDSGGYGQFYLKKKILAHRLSYNMFVGEIPGDLQIDHLCRVRCCVNPLHLEPVTRLENVRRGLSGHFNSAKSHCPRGHQYTPANTYIDKAFRRNCKKCRRIRQRAAKHGG